MTEQEAREVYNMASTTGYDYFKKFIDDKLQAAKKKLMYGDVESISELKSIQAEIKTLESIISYIEKRIKKIQ